MVLKHFHYLLYVVRHKWFVFIESRKLGIPWLGFCHDWSKFRWDEWRAYADHFHGKTAVKPTRDSTGYYKPTDTGDLAFDFAWHLHQKRNKHHWQWWTLPEDGGGIKTLRMPVCYLKEMLADWRGASRAQGSKSTVLVWYSANQWKMQLHNDTRAWVVEALNLEESKL